MENHVHLNLSGTKFEFSRSLLGGYDVTRLTRMCEEAGKSRGDPTTIFLDRSPECFAAILNYLQTGELHMPTTVCPGYFRRELEFWEIDGKCLCDCCRYRLQAHLEEVVARRKFLKEALETTSGSGGPCPGRVGRCMTRLWRVVDFGEGSVLAKVYFGLVFVMLLLSIGTLAYSTDPAFRRPLSKCELLEYMAHSEHTHHARVTQILGDVECDISRVFHVHLDGDHHDGDDYIHESFFQDWEYDENDAHSVFKKPDTTGTDTDTDTYIDVNNTNNATANTGNATTNTDTNSDAHRDTNTSGRKTLNIPFLTVRIVTLDILETVTILFFTVDFVLRIISCPSRVQYFFSLINAVDFLALLFCYIHIITVTFERHHRYGEGWISIINYLQVLRAMRFLRLFTSVRAGKVLVYSLKSNARDFVLVVLLLLFGISMFSTAMYFAEDRTNIKSIPEAWYWSVVTMTTVGYGDVSPKSGFGKVLASFCAICGVLFLAVALPLFVNNFLTLYQYSNLDDAVTPTANQSRKDKTSGELASNGKRDNNETPSPTSA